MECSRTLCEHIQRLVYVEVVVVVVGVTTVERELMWKAAYFKELLRQQ